MILAARFDFFCSNVKQMGILLEEKKARQAKVGTSLRVLELSCGSDKLSHHYCIIC